MGQHEMEDEDLIHAHAMQVRQVIEFHLAVRSANVDFLDRRMLNVEAHAPFVLHYSWLALHYAVPLEGRTWIGAFGDV